MSLFTALFTRLRNYVRWDFQMKSSLDAFGALLNGVGNPVVRMWVDDSPGSGHQASTVGILRQLANPMAQNGFAYTGIIEVYYAPGDAKNLTLPKLYMLLPELNNQPNGHVVGATVALIPWDDKVAPALVDLGFTGGADDVETAGGITSPNFAKRVGARYFLRVQPYRWGAPEQIQFFDEANPFITLTRERVMGMQSFNQRSYYVETPFPEPNWNFYAAGDFARQASIVRLLTAEDAPWCAPVYSIRAPGHMELAFPASERMFEVITSMMAAQRTGKNARDGARSLFVVSCDTFEGDEADMLPDLMKGGLSFRERSWQIDSDRGEDVMGTPLTARQKGRLEQLLRNHDFRKQYLADVGAEGRIKYLFDPTLQQVQQVLPWMQERDDRVVFLQLGRVPQPLFNYLLQVAPLPPVFEGQNTAANMLNLGSYYLHVARPASSTVQYPSTVVNYEEYDRADTDVPMMPVIFVPLLPRLLQDIANEINAPLDGWPALAADNPAERVGAFIKTYMAEGADGEYRTYFADIGRFYQNPNNDKFRYGAAFLQYIVAMQNAARADADGVLHAQALELAPAGPSPALALADPAPAAPGDPAVLEQLLAALEANRDAQGVLNLVPGTFPSGAIHDFYTGLLGAGNPLLITGSTITPQKDGTGALVSIAVAGASDALGFEMAAAYTFTAPQGAVVGNGRFVYDQKWSLDEIPWLVFSSPFAELYTTDANLPAVGAVGGTIDSAGVELAFMLPVIDDVWQLQGRFAAPFPSVDKFFAMAGGVNLVQALPAPFSTLAGFGVSSVQLAYDAAGKKISYVGVSAATQDGFDLLPGLRVNNIGAQVTVMDPASLATRQTSWSVQGAITIGSGPQAGVVTLGASGPGLVLQGQLASGIIQLADLLSIFLPGVEFTPQSLPVITEFQVSFTPATGDYSVSCNLNIGWTLSFASTQIVIERLGISANRNGGQLMGGLTGQITLGTGDNPFVLQLSASYDSTTSWTFGALQQEGTTFDLSSLFNTFLPAEWKVEQPLGITGFGITIGTGVGSFVFTGSTAEPWSVPFISGLTVAASLRAGYGPASGASLALATTGSGSVAPVGAGRSYFARVDTEWVWQNIDIKVWFDYNPTVNSFGITWGVLEGVVSGPDKTTGDYTATLRFTETVTLGSMVETMVSWVTGTRFGLESPWDFLNSIPLSGLALVYTFNPKDSSRNKVSFAVTIGPINLGFARIDSIGISYEDGKANVTLNGWFAWQDKPSEPLGWDASKPGQAPAPPGNGNKFLDLRLLAMGQHVTLPCFADADSVQKAIACMADLPDPEPYQTPSVVFDPQSSWLIGTDFGVLRIEPKSGGDGNGGGGTGTAVATTAPAPAAAPGYVLTLQAVFNDPHLYGLRVALAGDAAKIFAGLDFQIMYRQISDTVGVYQAEITLPDLMRHLSVGAYSITLPVFAIAVYTNGDFMVDIGFPWNEDFSRSFSIEAIIPPGIPVLGSAGFYFGKLSSATTNRVPTSTKGTFNPVLVFGFGMQVGFGKSIEYGILKAGFSITAVGILEGVIAKWNPYQVTDGGSEPGTQVQGAYYFWLRGTVGIVGKVYGSIDFAVVKADVNITVKLLLQITYESYVSISITVIASVEVSVSVKIDLGIFSIKLSFSFSMRLKETFTIANTGTPPWGVGSGAAQARGVLRAPAPTRMSALRAPAPAAFFAQSEQVSLGWGNLLAPATPAALTGYVAPALTVAADEWVAAPTAAGQVGCYVALLLIDSVPPAGQDGGASAARAAGTGDDTAFEALCKMVLRWAVAYLQPAPVTADQVDALPVSGVELDRLANEVLVSSDANPTPIPPEAADAFLAAQFLMTLRLPPAQAGSADATYFPVPGALKLSAAPYAGGYPGYAYTFGAYNTLDTAVLAELRAYFDQLAVQVQQEMDPAPSVQSAQSATQLSMSAWMFSDYFLLLARQMVQAAQDGLRDFKYPIAPAGQNQTPAEVLAWINDTGQLSGVLVYTLHDLFAANPSHPLTAGKTLTIGAGAAAEGTFTSVAEELGGSFPASTLAAANAADPAVLIAGATVTFAGKDGYAVQAGDTLLSIAAHFGAPFADLLADGNVLTLAGLLNPQATLAVPYVTYPTSGGDTFASVAALPAYGGAFTAARLATLNAGRPVLATGAQVAYPGKDPYTVQPRDTLGDVANAFGVSFADLLANSGVLAQAGVLGPVAVLAVPAFAYTTAAGDTLQSVATHFAVDVSVLGDQPANGDVQNLWATADADGTADPFLDVPHLPQFPVGELLKEAQRTGALQHLSGMASRYNLHGLRFPTTGITPLQPGMWVHDQGGTLTLPAQAGLFALTGQQLPLPALNATDPFTLAFDNGGGPGWLRFQDAAGAPASVLTVAVAPGSTDAARIANVTAYAASAALDVQLDTLGAGEMVHAEPASYPFTSQVVWQNAGPVTLPYGPPPAGVQSLRLWRLPDALAALPDPSTRSVDPRFSVQVARYDEATGATVTTPATQWGWGTLLGFTVKRTPAVAGSPASATTYEVVGAGGNDVLLLERLLAQVGSDDAFFQQLLLGYAPDSSTGAGDGVQTDPVAAVTMGIAQVNLSTETFPPAGAQALRMDEEAAPAGLGLLNTPTEFVRLLWEASITRSGGFFLYYWDADDARGLPDRVFNDRNEAQLSLVVLYAAPTAADEQNRVAGFMNAVATAEQVDTANSVVMAQADPVPATVAAGAADTLASLAWSYYADPADVAAANADLPFAAGAAIAVTEGVYQAPPGGIALSAVASAFGTTVAALNAANPGAGGLPDPLPFPAAVRLPALALVAGTSAHATSLADVAGYYGEGLTALAAHNAAVPGIFAGRSVTVPGGPMVRTATVAAGVQAVAASRPTPAPVPTDPAAPDFASLFLLNGFSLLSQQVYGNADFTASDPGLPAGPTTVPADTGNAGKMRAVRMADEVEEWDYSQALPYYRFAKGVAQASTGTLPPQAENPYQGVGGLLQVSFGWLDYFGNTLVTTLSDPPTGSAGPFNAPPLLTGYTDALVALSRWPSVASSWQVGTGSAAGKAQLQLTLGFDPSRYQGVLQAQATGATSVAILFTDPLDPASATEATRYRLVPEVDVQSASLSGDGLTVTLAVAGLADGLRYTVVASDVAGTAAGSSYSGQAGFDYPDDPQTRTSTVQQNAQQDLHVYTQLYYQLTDPNGVAYSLESTLLGAAAGESGSVPLPQADADALFAWLFGPAGTPSAFAYVQDRSRFGTTAPAPAASLPLAVEVDASAVNPAEIFELWLSFALERTGGAVLGDLETTPGIRRAATRVAPLQDALGSAGAPGLTTFARGYEAALSSAAYLRKVATGNDRTRATPAGGSGATVWSVRLGLTVDEPIAYAVTDAGDPAIFAPRPASNQLQTRPQVPIYDYATGTGISTTPSRYVDFSEVDLDTWCQQAFAAVDGVLTPQFTAPIQIVDHFTGNGWLQRILDGKKALAGLASQWMIPVFADETADPAQAREAFYQQLLVRLAAAYTTRAAVEFQARVTGLDADGPESDTPPRLFGSVSRTGPNFEAAFVEGTELSTVFLRFSVPMDRASATDLANYTLSDDVLPLTATLDANVVTLTTSKPVVSGTTTVTVANLVDVLGSPVRPPLVQTVTTGAVEEPADTLVFSSPRLSLATADQAPLTFLLSAPETVRGAGGEVVSYVQLGLEYEGAQIEHQIGSVPGIQGYVASSWLSFVTPPGDALTADLGSFPVPMVLRAFPASPTMAAQSGTPTYGLDTPELSQLTRWSYAFTYSLPFHYPQDRVYGEVEFNLQQLMSAQAGFEDAFNQLAEFVNVFPEVDQDFQSLLATIDATTDPVADKEKVDNASVALQSFVQLVDNLVTAAGGDPAARALARARGVEPRGLTFPAPSRTMMGDTDLTYTFYVQEGEVDVGDTRDALLVSLVGAVPAGIDSPCVLVAPDQYEPVPYTPEGGAQPDTLSFVYRRTAGTGSDGSYLTAADGQTVADRTVVLPDMDILQRQDASSSVYLTRNQTLVPDGRQSAPPFVYTTPEVRFSNPLFPTNDSQAEVNVAGVGGQGTPPPPVARSLEGQLQNLFAVLLANNTQPELTIQVEVSYAYPLNPSLSSVPLPVMMQAPLGVTVAGDGAGTLQAMIAGWTAALELWFTTHTPTCGGTLWMDLTIMSDLTQQPMPLLRLRKLYLPLQYVQPALPCGSNG